MGSMGRSSMLLAVPPPLDRAFIVTEVFMTLASALEDCSDSELWARVRYLLGEEPPQSRELAAVVSIAYNTLLLVFRAC